MNQEFSQTVDKYSTSVFRCAYTYCNNRQDAEDIMQEVFMKYLTKKPEFADEAHEEDYLGMEVKVQGIDVENTTVKMTPDKLKMCEEIQIETVYIDRLGIDMVGNCEKDVLWDTEKEIRPTLYEIRKSVGIVDPEVIVEMKDGTRICLLLDESKELSMEVDKEMEITLLSHNNGLIYHEGVWSNTIVTGLEYKFTEVLDTEQIVKVWIEGVEQDFSK